MCYSDFGTDLPDSPEGVNLIKVETAEEMFSKVKEHYASNQVIIKAAAVSDYRPKFYQEAKIKKSEGDLQIVLGRNPDILNFLGQNKGKRILVGFAAETNDLQVNAQKKITKKNLDFIVANDVTEKGAGFNYDTNKVTLFFPSGRAKKICH